MGQLILPSAGPVYVDANAVIYLVERIEPYFTASLPFWNALDAGACEVVKAQLTVLELLFMPLREANGKLSGLFRQLLLGTSALTCRPIDLSILEAAAQLRATLNIKTPDAIHAATAQAAGCSLFVTNDGGF